MGPLTATASFVTLANKLEDDAATPANVHVVIFQADDIHFFAATIQRQTLDLTNIFGDNSPIIYWLVV
jgi:hypothetical protein